MKPAAAAVIVALVTHLAFFAVDPAHEAPDSHKYRHPAEALLAGEGFVHDGHPETLMTPGYSVVLAALQAIGVDDTGVVVLQHVASALVAGAVVLTLFHLTRSSVAAWVAAIYLALDLPTIVHASLILSETVFTVWLTLCAWATWRLAGQPAIRVWPALGLGLALGLLPLVRPVAMLFAMVPVAVVGVSGGHRRAAVLILVASLIAPGLWTLRNLREVGVASLSTNGAVLVADYHAPGVLAMDDPGGMDANLERRRDEVRRLADARVRSVLGRDPASVPQPERAATDMQVGREVLLAHPWATARLVAYGLAGNLLGASADAITRLTPLSREVATRVLLPWNLAALVLYALGQIWLLRHHRRAGLVILLTVGYFIATTAGAISYSRFRVPIVPLYAMAIGCGAHVLVARLTGRSARRG